MKHRPFQRRLPIGAEVSAPGRTHFRVWAPKARRIDLVIETDAAPEADRTFQPLAAEGAGYFSGEADGAAGTRYRFRVNEGEHLHPDPASRYQPGGPHRSSSVVDHRDFRWTDEKWPGVELKGQIIYEMHVGTFTPEGTWAAAARQLPELARTGISVIEMMPIADFPGEFGWGYDGVDSLRALPALRRAGRPAAIRQYRALVRHGRDP